jgi:hypothetical protein
MKRKLPWVKSVEQPRRRTDTSAYEARREVLPQQPNQFQRNRTLPQQPKDQSVRSQAHQLRLLRRRILLIVAFGSGIVVVTLFIASQLMTSVRVSLINTAHAVNQSQQSEYKKVIEEYLDTHPIERLRFAVNTPQLLRIMQETHPEVDTLSVRSDGLGKAAFIVTAKKPVAMWVVGSTTLFVDTDGITFKDNYYATPQVQVVDNSGASVPQGQAVASSRLLSFVGQVVAKAQARNFSIAEIEIPAGAIRKVAIRMKDVPPKIYMTIDRGAGEQVDDMVDTLNYMKNHSITADYIDVRTPSKAFYK